MSAVATLDREHDRDRVRSLEKGLAVIRAFTAQRPRLTLAEVARETGISRAAARRLLLTLESLGYVGSDGRMFFLRPALLQLGFAYLSSTSVATVAQGHLENLNEELHESCSASVLDRESVVYVARSSTNRIMTIGLSVGTRLPAYCTSMGRVLLAGLTPEALDQYFANAELVPLTSSTVYKEADIRSIVAEVKRVSWSILDQELEAGVRSVAVPIKAANGNTVAAINSSAHASRVSLTELEERFLPALQRCAREIELDLAGRPN